MLTKLRTLLKKPTRTLGQIREEFRNDFFSSDYHDWINQDRYIKRGFSFLLDSLTPRAIEFLKSKEGNVIFAKGNGKLGVAVGATKDTHIIIVYPDLIKMLKSGAPLFGVAVLAHELGHVINQHVGKNIDKLEAQCEADEFAWEVGLGHELQEVLLDLPHSLETKVRVARLSSLIVQKFN